MPTLDLARRTVILDSAPFDWPASGCSCVVEAKPGLSRGYVAAIAPARPGDTDPWRRAFLRPTGESRRPGEAGGAGRWLLAYAGLAEGPHEAHSVLRAGRAHRVVFRVRDGAIAVLDDGGDARAVLAALGWAAPVVGDDGLPRLVGSPAQVDWARTIRLGILPRLAGRPDLASILLQVVDATYFVANRNRPPADWPPPAPRQIDPAAAPAPAEGQLF